MSYLLNLIPKGEMISIESIECYPEISRFFAESREESIIHDVPLEKLSPEQRVLQKLLNDVDILVKDATGKGIEWDIKLKESDGFEKVLKFLFTFAEEEKFEVYDPQLEIKVNRLDFDAIMGHRKQYDQGYLIDDNYDPNGASKFLIKFLLIMLGFYLIFTLANSCNGLMINGI